MTALAIQQREHILQELATGKLVSDVAKPLGIAPQNISKQLAHDPDYQAAREHGVEQRLAKARQSVLEIAGLGIDEETGEITGISPQIGTLARVRVDALKAEMWFAEREFPHRWGQQKDQGQVAVQVVIQNFDNEGEKQVVAVQGKAA